MGTKELIEMTDFGKNLFGTSRTQTISGSTQTQGLDITKQGFDRVLQQLMESSQGLAPILQGQKQAGLYNSTVNTQLLSEFMTRAAGELAKLQAKQVTTDTGKTVKDETQGLVRNKDAQVATGAMILKSLLTKQGSKLVQEKVAAPALKKLKDVITGEATSATEQAMSGVITETGATDYLGNAVSNMFSESAVPGFSAMSGDLMGSAVSDMLSSEGTNFAIDLLSEPVTDFVGDSFGGSIPGIGSAFSYFDAAKNFFDGDGGRTAAVGEAAGAYFGGPIGAAIGKVAGDLLSEPLGKVDDALHDVGSWIDDEVFQPVKEFINDLCYITTAVCEYQGKKDDCYELQTLRGWRDEYVKKNHPTAILDYYKTAPKIVETIKKRIDAEEIFNRFFNKYIVNVVAAVEAGEPKAAYEIYSDLINDAKYEAAKGA
jgi:hypothetical protein